MKYICYIIFAMSLLTVPGNAQEEAEAPSQGSLEEGTLQSQFDYMLENSNRFQTFKVVKQTWLNTFMSHVSDSLNEVRADLISERQVIETQRIENSSLQKNLNMVQDSLQVVNGEKASIKFLGRDMAKGSYKTMMWSITAALLALLLVFIFRFNRSNAVTKESKKQLLSTEEEFETFKKTAREREQVLKRELQDEINKHI